MAPDDSSCGLWVVEGTLPPYFLPTLGICLWFLLQLLEMQMVCFCDVEGTLNPPEFDRSRS